MTVITRRARFLIRHPWKGLENPPGAVASSLPPHPNHVRTRRPFRWHRGSPVDKQMTDPRLKDTLLKPSGACCGVTQRLSTGKCRTGNSKYLPVQHQYIYLLQDSETRMLSSSLMMLMQHKPKIKGPSKGILALSRCRMRRNDATELGEAVAESINSPMKSRG